MKKALLIVLVLALSLSFASFAFAGDRVQDARPFQGARQRSCDLPLLTVSDEYKAQMITLRVQMHELRKKIIQSNIDSGSITKEQGEIMQEREDSRIEAIKSGDFRPGLGRRGRGPGLGRCQLQQPQAADQ